MRWLFSIRVLMIKIIMKKIYYLNIIDWKCVLFFYKYDIFLVIEKIYMKGVEYKL